MTQLHQRPNKSDAPSQPESHDACPTCGQPAAIKATCTASGHDYRLECSNCPWFVPIHRPQQPTLVTDGGTIATQPTTDDNSARDILDDLHYDESVARLCEHLATGDSDLSGEDCRRALSKATDLCLVFEHRSKTEFVTISDGDLQAAYYRAGDAHVCGPMTLEADHLESRLPALADVCLLEDAPAAIGGGR
ncbi:hypothetical protein [Natronosalvus halobius]|uniref:hypothetical protein n=1 Tax=Natronosalvus halobius TaxID=2953746 RepID=UPI00209D7C88|nr:hypothetical protein [Natronosalvus halobius]USZ73741.1 hypothetical protein NGM15_18565 [Natronosalvus halobius]